MKKAKHIPHAKKNYIPHEHHILLKPDQYGFLVNVENARNNAQRSIILSKLNDDTHNNVRNNKI